MIKNKRLKSFGINITSYIGAALLALVASPLFPELIAWVSKNINERAAALGIPAIVVSVVGFIISEIWRNILNKQILAEKKGMSSGPVDLY